MDEVKKIFCEPKKGMKSKEAIELCDRLYLEMKGFIQKIEEYYNAVDTGINVQECYTYVANNLDRASRFAAFKRAIVRNDYINVFGEELNR